MMTCTPINRQLVDRAIATQLTTLGQLQSIPGSISGGWVIDPGPLNEVATERCGNDAGHGPGTCVFPHTDGLCPACTVEYIQRTLVAGDQLAIDVLL